MELEKREEIYKSLKVLSYSRSQGYFHTESIEQYIKGSLIDIESDSLLGCDYRAIGFYFTNEERFYLEAKYRKNSFKKVSIDFIEKFRGFKIW